MMENLSNAMIKLYQFPSYWGMPSPSPFCMKVETYLKMTGIAYEPVYTGNPAKAPKGKLPYIEINNAAIADSHIIIEVLEARQAHPLDEHLTPTEKAISLMAKRMLDEHFFWVILYSRWVPKKNWAIIKTTFFSKAPWLIRKYLAKSIRKRVLRSLRLQGMSLHTVKEIYQFGDKDLQALSILLGENLYFFGEKPSTLDACAYAFLAAIMHAPIESPLKRDALKYKNLVALCERIDATYFKSS